MFHVSKDFKIGTFNIPINHFIFCLMQHLKFRLLKITAVSSFASSVNTAHTNSPLAIDIWYERKTNTNPVLPNIGFQVDTLLGRYMWSDQTYWVVRTYMAAFPSKNAVSTNIKHSSYINLMSHFSSIHCHTKRLYVHMFDMVDTP